MARAGSRSRRRSPLERVAARPEPIRRRRGHAADAGARPEPYPPPDEATIRAFRRSSAPHDESLACGASRSHSSSARRRDAGARRRRHEEAPGRRADRALQDKLAAQRAAGAGAAQRRSTASRRGSARSRRRSATSRCSSQTLEEDLALHQQRLAQLNGSSSSSRRGSTFLRAQYAESIDSAEPPARRHLRVRRAVDARLRPRRGDRSQEALDQVDYMTDIGEQDRRIATEVAHAKAQVQAARAKTKQLRGDRAARDAQVIRPRTAQTRDVRDELARRARRPRRRRSSRSSSTSRS